MFYTRGTFKANQAQTEAITHPLAPLMILAGAGTGKTTTLLHRIIYLIEYYRIDPAHILAITYTEKAAEELKSRIISEVGFQAEAITVGTFHSFCYSIVKEYSPLQHDPPRLMEEGDAIFLLLERFDELGPFESTEFAMDPVKAVVKSFIPFFNRLRDELINLDQPQIPPEYEDETNLEILAQLNDLKRIFPIFQKWKTDLNRVDFGDMILKCHNMMSEDDELLNTLRSQYQSLIIDEFQDNNYALNEVIGKIARIHGNITVVGDEDQVIYSFRGASSYNIHDFKRRYGQFDQYRQIALEENFRSHQQILDVANAVIKNNQDREEKTLQSVNHLTGPFPELWYGGKSAQLLGLSGIISHLINRANYTYGDIAVLCRTRNQVKEIIEYLQPSHLPTCAFLTEYFEIPAIREVIAWCQVIGKGKYMDSAFFRLLAIQVNETTANRWYNRYKRRDRSRRFDLIADDPGIQSDPHGADIRELIETIQSLRKDVAKKSAGEMVWEICEKTNLFRPLINRYEYQDQTAIMNLGDFILRAQTFSRRHPDNPSLSAFINYIDTLQDSGRITAQLPSPIRKKPAVLVQTIHSVKGGEFPVVFIPFNRSQSFPLNYRPGAIIEKPPDSWLTYSRETSLTPKEHHLQEERRLFYVAITRARERLFLLAPPQYTSPFIKEIPNNFLEVHNMETPTVQTPTSSVSQLRNRYEQRLNEALSRDQFHIVRDLINAVERLAAIEKKEPVSWGNSPWEVELKKALPKHIEWESPEKLYLSASAIETYDQCPLKYRLGYIDKVPETISKPQLTFGIIIHQVLEQFHRNSEPQTEQRLLELLDQNWQPGEFDYAAREEKFKDQGIAILKRYYRYIQANPPRIVEREYPFSFDLQDICIRGKIDRIDYGYEGFNVVDYKTGKKATDPKKNLQLAVYSLFLEQQPDLEFGGLPESAILYFLREKDDPIKSHTFTPAELEKIRQKIYGIGKNIRNREFSPRRGFHCDWCDYKNLLCPAWEGI